MTRILSLAFVAVALSFTACGVTPDTYAGSWNQTGTFTASANGQSQVQQLSGALEVRQGTDGNSIVVPLSSQCMVPFDLAGNTATVHPGVSCDLAFSDGHVVLTVSSGTIMLGSTLKTMTLTMGGTETFTFQDGSTGVATWTQNATLNKVSK